MKDTTEDKDNSHHLTPKNIILLEEWKTASELHQHEDDLSWRKFNYFIAANSVLISVIAAGWSVDAKLEVINLAALFIPVSIFGTLISFVWTLTQKRGQF